MSHVLALQRQRNVQTRDAWDSFAGHRARVMQLIEQCVAERAKLLSTDSSLISVAVLGAGNCNDLDMNWLAATVAKVVLVDCDRQAVEQGLARQLPDPPTSISIHAPCDLSGLADAFEDWSEPQSTAGSQTTSNQQASSPHASSQPTSHPPENEPPVQSQPVQSPPGELLPEEVLQQLTKRPLLDWGPNLAGTIDVAVSTCLLTQMIDTVAMSLGGKHPQFLRVVQAVRQRHLREIVGLLKPGGCGVLVSDFVASDSWPELVNLEDPLLPPAVAEQLRRANFFTGVNPLVIGRQLIQEPPFDNLVTKVGVTQAWKWRLGNRVYAVCGIHFQRTAQNPS